MDRQKIAYLETVRGIACVLLVSFHVVGNSRHHGLRLPGDHWMRLVNDLFGDARMPLFSLISGIVFSWAVASRSEWAAKVGKKAKRLLVPMVTVATLQYVAMAAVDKGESIPLWQIYVLPFRHFWFL